jgi:hypothetical protein
MLSYIDSVIEHVLDIAVCSRGKNMPCPNSQQILYDVSVQGHGPDASPKKEPQKSPPH